MKLNDLQKQFIKRSLLETAIDSADANPNVEFQAREFFLCRLDNGDYLPYESIPTGAITRQPLGSELSELDLTYEKDICDLFETNPNLVGRFLERKGIDPGALCRVVLDDYESPTLSFPSPEQAVDAVIAAIESNELLVSSRVVSKARRSFKPGVLEKRRQILQSLEFWRQSRFPESQHETLFADKKDPFGDELGAEYKNAILSYLNAPSIQSWEQIRSIYIVDFTTVWQAVIAQDRSTPIGGEEIREDNLPSPEIVIQALSSAVSRHNRNCERKICEIERKLAEFDQMHPATPAITLIHPGG